MLERFIFYLLKVYRNWGLALRVAALPGSGPGAEGVQGCWGVGFEVRVWGCVRIFRVVLGLQGFMGCGDDGPWFKPCCT